MILRSFAGGVLGSLMLALLAACSIRTENLLPDRRPDYRVSQVGSPLEIPPDLTSSTIDDTLVVPELTPTGTASLSDYTSERAGDGRIAAPETVLQDQTGLRVARAGDRRWLTVDQPADGLWPKVKSFWTDNGFALQRDDPRTGIMETEWLENRADIPDGMIREVLKKFLDFAYSAATRDKFRVRLEPNGTATDVYLTHYGVQEVATGTLGESVIWQPRPRDPELEAEMLNRLLVHLGASERRAQTQLADATPASSPRARLVDTADGYRALVIEADYDNAWRLVGFALDSNNFVIEDQNRAEGLYVVEPAPAKPEQKRGFLARLLGNDEEVQASSNARYQVRLAGRGAQTLVVVQNQQGSQDNSPTAQQLLESVRTAVQ